jgi:hypothetical protein
MFHYTLEKGIHQIYMPCLMMSLELEGSMLAFELLASSHPHSPKESECEQESKAPLYTPDLVDSCLHEALLTLSKSEEDGRESFGVPLKLQNQLSKESLSPLHI